MLFFCAYPFNRPPDSAKEAKFKKALNYKGSWPFLLRKNLWKLSYRCSGPIISSYQQFPTFSM